jgi:hypothetical protein
MDIVVYVVVHQELSPVFQLLDESMQTCCVESEVWYECL